MSTSGRQFTQGDIAKSIAARKAAVPKAIIAKAVKRFCLECWGVNPGITDCQAHTLLDGTSCELYQVNTAAKRRKTTKTALRKAVRKNCVHCLGGSTQDTCTSPHCHLNSYRLGRMPAENPVADLPQGS